MGITKAYDLTVNYLGNPVGIDTVPAFSYKLAQDGRGAVQASRRIIVASSIDKLDKPDLWDSGTVACDNSLHIEYSGSELEPVKRCWWRVEATDTEGNRVISEPAFFVTGKRGSRWNANWITAAFTGEGKNAAEREESSLAAPYLRREFKVTKPVKEAFLVICGLGYFEAYLNGGKVGDDVLCTPFTRFDEEVMYITYDVAAMLKNGGNAIGITLGNGWYNCFAEDPWNTRQAAWRHLPKVIAELRVEYADGSSELIATRPDWTSSSGPIYFNGIRNGEHYDARRELGDWTNAGYDDSGWRQAKTIRAPGGRLEAMEMQPIKIMHELPAKKVWQEGDGWVFDIAQNQAGIARFKLRGKAGTEFTMQYSDTLDANGIFTQKTIDGFIRSYGFQTDKYTKKSDAEEIWQPKFVYHGFQYVRVTGMDYTPSADDVTGLTEYTSFADTGKFECSDELLNSVQHLCRWSAMSNCESIITDCPHREKNGWTGDGAVSSEQILINFAAQPLYSKWLGDMRTSQRPSGSIPCVVPSTGWGYNSMNGPDWSAGLTSIPWTIYKYNDDKRVLRLNYEAIKRHCDFMESMTSDYTLNYGLGDWCAPFEGPAISINMGAFKCPTAVTDTAFFYDAAVKIVKIAEVLGMSEDADYYRELAVKIRAAFRKAFYDAKTHTVAGNCQTSTAVMLYFGLADEDEKPALLAKLIEQIHEKDDHLDFGLIGCKAVMHTLGSMGEGNIGFKMLAQRSFPGCKQWLDLGATTLWECWNGGGSHNHHMFSDLSAFMYKYVGGISPDENRPGFAHTILRPAIDCGLNYANCEFESMHGTLKCDWKNENGQQELNLVIPVGCTATLYLPSHYEGKLTENGKPLAAPAKSENGEYSVTLACGSYRIAAQVK